MDCLSFIYRRFKNHAPHSPGSRKPNLMILPAELIIHTTLFLPPESSVLLSLVSRQLRLILPSNHVSLSFDNPMTKRKFLLLLTRDMPEYLACRRCNHIFRWQWLIWPTCLYCLRHLRLYGLAQICVCFRHKFTVCPELIDLMLRGHEQGLQYGLPMSYLDHHCEFAVTDPTTVNVGAHVQASIVGGQVFIVGQYKIIVDLKEDSAFPFWPLNRLLCRHVTWDIEQEMRAEIQRCLESRILQYDMGPRGCPKCATDYRVKLHLKPDDRAAHVEISSWRNFGNQCPEDPCVTNMLWPTENESWWDGTNRHDVRVRGLVEGRNLELQSVTGDVGEAITSQVRRSRGTDT